MSDIQGSGVVWEEPPSRNTSGVEHAKVAAALRSKPGQWAKIAAGAPGKLTADIKNGNIAPYRPAGSFEAVSRNTHRIDGLKTPRADIYARYVGDAT